MNTISQKLAIGVSVAVAVLAAPLANAAPDRYSTTTFVAPHAWPAPRLDRPMQWFRWHPAARSVQRSTAQFGSVAVIGLQSMRDLRSLRARYGFEVVRVLPELHAAEVRVNRPLLWNAELDGRIRYLTPLGSNSHLAAMPNDPLLRTTDPTTNLPFEWQFASSHVDRALDLSPGNPGIVVGTIDTGADTVPDLAGKVDARWTIAQDGTLRRDAQGNDSVGHGTAVASLIAANVDDGFGMAGFGGATHLIAIRVQPLTDTLVAIALMKLDTLGVRIVNMSFGKETPEEPILLDAMHKAAADGLLLVAATGNSASPVAYPAADLQVPGGMQGLGLAVGASDVDGNLAGFSNAGEKLSLVAPGDYKGSCSGVLVAVAVLSDVFDNSCHPNWAGAGNAIYAYAAGTSFAAPEVAGVAALIWAARPELKNYQVAGIIKQSARRDGAGWTPTMGCGVLDAGAALELATSRSAAEWANRNTPDAASCSADGNDPPAWPTGVDQTITFDGLAHRTVGDPDFTVTATASSGLPVSLAASGQCAIIGAVVHITGAGACAITASQPGDSKYNPAPSILRRFSIAKAIHTATTVLALPALGKWGAPVRLAYRVTSPTGELTASITVEKDHIQLAHFSRGLVSFLAGRVHTLAWKAPKSRTSGRLRFCVTISNRTRTESAVSCARIRLR